MSVVVTVCSHIRPEPYYHYVDGFLGSLAKLGVEPVVLGFNEGWEGLITKPKRLRHWLRNVCPEDEIVIACDANDVVFQEHPDSIAERWQSLWPERPLVWNSERNLFPRSDLAEFFPETGTPWRYLNSGFMIGTRNDMLTMVETADWDSFPVDQQVFEETTIVYNGHIPFTGSAVKVYQPQEWVSPNDQGDYQEIWSKMPVPMALDTKAELCICCHGSELDDFDLTGPKIKNRLTDTVPGVFHCNGGAKDVLLPQLLAHWGL